LKQNNSKWPDLNVNAHDQCFFSSPPQFFDLKNCGEFFQNIIKVLKFTLLRKAQIFCQKHEKKFVGNNQSLMTK
jgi:hypothetical protein